MFFNRKVIISTIILATGHMNVFTISETLFNDFINYILFNKTFLKMIKEISCFITNKYCQGNLMVRFLVDWVTRSKLSSLKATSCLKEARMKFITKLIIKLRLVLMLKYGKIKKLSPTFTKDN